MEGAVMVVEMAVVVTVAVAKEGVEMVAVGMVAVRAVGWAEEAMVVAATVAAMVVAMVEAATAEAKEKVAAEGVMVDLHRSHPHSSAHGGAMWTHCRSSCACSRQRPPRSGAGYCVFRCHAGTLPIPKRTHRRDRILYALQQATQRPCTGERHGLCMPCERPPTSTLEDNPSDSRKAGRIAPASRRWYSVLRQLDEASTRARP